MKLSEKYLEKQLKEHCDFPYVKGELHPDTKEQLTGTYTDEGMTVDEIKLYGEICYWEGVFDLDKYNNAAIYKLKLIATENNLTI